MSHLGPEKVNAVVVSAHARILFPNTYIGIVVSMIPKVKAVKVEKYLRGPAAL